MKNRLRQARWTLGALAMAGVVAISGCVETELQGVIIEDDINDPDLMMAFVRGINSELHDNMRDFSGVWWYAGAATDDFNNDGVGSSSEEVLEYRNYQDRPGNFPWEQVHEAAWAGYYGVKILGDVYGDQAASHPLVARSWIISGWAERMMAELFCETVYNYGPGAGPLIGDNSAYDPTRMVPADSAARRSLSAMQQALAVAEAAVAAGAPTPDNDDLIFGPERLMYAAHAGIAQAAVLLGDWPLAVQHAAQVPDDFIIYSHADPEVEHNGWHDAFIQNDDPTLWNTPVHRVFQDDPRVPWAKCGEWETDTLRTQHGHWSEISRTGRCDNIEGKNFEYRAESNDMPLYATLKAEPEGLLTRPNGDTGDDADFPMARGTEMLLIRAENALRNGDLAGFASFVNQARAVYGMDPIATPATAGSMEYPNALDDGWSILDGERYTLMHLEGRRYADMKRWQHPYIAEGHVINTRIFQENGPSIPVYCMPVADIECDANPLLDCPAVGGGS